MTEFDPFAFGGRQDDVDTLFQQWIAAARDVDATVDKNAAEYNSALERMTKGEGWPANCRWPGCKHPGQATW